MNGLSLHSRVNADAVAVSAPPIVLIHGLLVSSRYMIPTARLLARTFRVFALDMPGYGRSDHPPHVLTVPELADAVEAWSRAAGIETAVFLGNSFGCQVVVDMAVRYPYLAERLILTGPTLDPAAHNPLVPAMRLLQDAFLESLTLHPLLVRDTLAAGPRRAIGTYRSLLNDHIELKLPLITMPTLFVRGERDPIVPQAWLDEATRRTPGAQQLIVPGAPHALNYSRPYGLVDAISPFLDAAHGSLRTADGGRSA